MTAKKRKMTPSFRVIDGELKMLKGKSWVTPNERESHAFLVCVERTKDELIENALNSEFDKVIESVNQDSGRKEISFSRCRNSALLVNISSNHISQLNALCGLFENLSEKAKLIPKDDVSKEAYEQGKSCYELMSGILEGHANITEALEAQSVIVQKMAILLELEQVTLF